MAKREAMTLTGVCVVHNIILIVLSALMAVGAWESLVERFETEGLDGLFCSQRALINTLDGSAGFWMKVYFLSKFYEFGDTVLLVLKKKPTIPLHLYHHAIMVFLTWSWCRFSWLEGSLWCVLVNSVIHFFMYTYYMLAALGQSVWWKRYLTGAQIFQFCTGFLYVCTFYLGSFTKGCGEATELAAQATAWSGPYAAITGVLAPVLGNNIAAKLAGTVLQTKFIVSLPTFAVNVTFISMFYSFFKAGAAPKKTSSKKLN